MSIQIASTEIALASACIAQREDLAHLLDDCASPESKARFKAYCQTAASDIKKPTPESREAYDLLIETSNFGFWVCPDDQHPANSRAALRRDTANLDKTFREIVKFPGEFSQCFLELTPGRYLRLLEIIEINLEFDPAEMRRLFDEFIAADESGRIAADARFTFQYTVPVREVLRSLGFTGQEIFNGP